MIDWVWLQFFDRFKKLQVYTKLDCFVVLLKELFTNYILGRVIGLTPPLRDDINIGRRKRDITSSGTTSEYCILFSMKDVLTKTN